MINLIPYPAHVREHSGKFRFSQNMTVWYDEELEAVKPFFTEMLGCELEEQKSANTDFIFVHNKRLGDEQYKLIITEKTVSVESASVLGALYAIQSIRQLGQFDLDGDHEMPVVDIRDRPRFQWRGLAFDDARHFFGKEEVKRRLDFMFLHKLNVFHWHLTDDQGWRIEIKKYPLLTQVGSKRKDTAINGWQNPKCEMMGKPHEGFYTQDDIREVVTYAAERGIMIVPEIDMPAHFLAAIASYPWLACVDKPREVAVHFGGKKPIDKSIACAGKETTYEFIYNVIDELCELFPAPYLHIGGDEAPKDEWKKCPKCQAVIKENNLKNEEDLQGYFTNKIRKYLLEKGKHLIGWNEILKADCIDKDTICQYWTPQRDPRVERFVASGGKVIMSKHQSFYFDLTYAERTLKATYMFEPSKQGIQKENMNNVIGVEGESWSEWILDREKLDVYSFPRIQALAEVAWTPSRKRDWKKFLLRWDNFKPVLRALGADYAEDAVCIPKWYKRLSHRIAFYYRDTYSEVKLNRNLKSKNR